MMKNTLIANADMMIIRYREAMMDFLNDTQGDKSVEDFARDLVDLSRAIQNLSSKAFNTALIAFKDELAAGYTMMMFDHEEFDQLEAWSAAGEDFQIAIFREDGSPVGVVQKKETSW